MRQIGGIPYMYKSRITDACEHPLECYSTRKQYFFYYPATRSRKNYRFRLFCQIIYIRNQYNIVSKFLQISKLSLFALPSSYVIEKTN